MPEAAQDKEQTMSDKDTKTQSGSPGTTPGSAEGEDDKTVNDAPANHPMRQSKD